MPIVVAFILASPFYTSDRFAKFNLGTSMPVGLGRLRKVGSSLYSYFAGRAAIKPRRASEFILYAARALEKRMYKIVSSVLISLILCFSGTALSQTLNEVRAAFRAKDCETARNGLLSLAKSGNAKAQELLGWAYQKGDCVAKDTQQSIAWLRESAEQGNAAAQTGLGYIYRDGNGVTKDQDEAVNWFRKSAEQNDPLGQYGLGLEYEQGYGVPEDAQQALVWYNKAAQQGVVAAKEHADKLLAKEQAKLSK